MVDGEFAFTEADFRRISAMVHGDAGIHLPDAKATLVYSRLAKRLRALGLTSFKDYCALVAGAEGVDERQKMLAALTTNVTRFFREPHHFDHLKEKVLPPLLDAARRGGKVRIWSAACSSGQEPFSIAMTILSLMPEAPERDVKILATDIDPNMVAAARNAAYSEDLIDAIPAGLRNKYLERDPEARHLWRLSAAVRDLVRVQPLNLIGDWPMKGSFDAIFCRNVAIYFEDDTQARLWSRFAPLNKVGGALYIGHSERIQGSAVDLYKPDGVTTYRRIAEGAR
jgi:chemotaxis protein methyltransferase CheR